MQKNKAINIKLFKKNNKTRPEAIFYHINPNIKVLVLIKHYAKLLLTLISIYNIIYKLSLSFIDLSMKYTSSLKSHIHLN